MDGIPAQLGIGGIFAILVIQLVLNFLKDRRNGGRGCRPECLLRQEGHDALLAVLKILEDDPPRGTTEALTKIHSCLRSIQHDLKEWIRGQERR